MSVIYKNSTLSGLPCETLFTPDYPDWRPASPAGKQSGQSGTIHIQLLRSCPTYALIISKLCLIKNKVEANAPLRGKRKMESCGAGGGMQVEATLASSCRVQL